MTILKWTGTAFLLLGLIMLGQKMPEGFLFTCAGECCWLHWSIKQKDPALITVCGVFAIVALFNYFGW